MNRRSFLRSFFATAAIATGLARTRLELVDDPEQLTYKGVPITWDDPRNWWLKSSHEVEYTGSMHEAMERAWLECIKPSTPPPDVIFCGHEGLMIYRADTRAIEPLSHRGTDA